MKTRVCLKYFVDYISHGEKAVRKNILACFLSVHNTISLSRYEQVCLIRLRFERYFSNHRAMGEVSIMVEVSLET